MQGKFMWDTFSWDNYLFDNLFRTLRRSRRHTNRTREGLLAACHPGLSQGVHLMVPRVSLAPHPGAL